MLVIAVTAIMDTFYNGDCEEEEVFIYSEDEEASITDILTNRNRAVKYWKSFGFQNLPCLRSKVEDDDPNSILQDIILTNKPFFMI